MKPLSPAAGFISGSVVCVALLVAGLWQAALAGFLFSLILAALAAAWNWVYDWTQDKREGR